MKRIILIFSCLLAFLVARADGLRMPGFFSDNMVLQQNTDANIWGLGLRVIQLLVGITHLIVKF